MTTPTHRHDPAHPEVTGIHRRLCQTLIGASLAVMQALTCHAGALVLDLEEVADLPAVRSTHLPSSPTRALTVDGILLQGGMVVDIPAGHPLSRIAGSRRLYGTAGEPGVHPPYALRRVLEIHLPADLRARGVSGTVFNGRGTRDSFVLSAYSATGLVHRIVLRDIASDLAIGHASFHLRSPAASIVRIEISNAAGSGQDDEWHFLVGPLRIDTPNNTPPHYANVQSNASAGELI